MNAISGISLAKNLLARIYVANPQHAETSIILPQKWHSTVLFPESDYSYHLGCITVEKHTAYGIIKWGLVKPTSLRSHRPPRTFGILCLLPHETRKLARAMVFRGKPSKACQRCRDRRIKCDFSIPSCSPCIRAQAVCTGYRDTQQIRIRNETQAVRTKALLKYAHTIGPRSLTPSLELRARDAFFAFHVIRVSRSWDFMARFHDSTLSPEHLTLSIDAVSLAYLSHQTSSDVALMTATEKYVSALRMTNRALQSPELATKDTTLLSALLLDLFEKITNTSSRHTKSWVGHVHGALALVKLRGLENFQDPSALRIMERLSNNLLISSVAADSGVPVGLIELRAHIAKHLQIKSLKWELSELMIPYSNLLSDIKNGHLSTDYYLETSAALDAKFASLCLVAPPSWQYSTKIFDQQREHTYDSYYDLYPSRHVSQAWNVIRLIRIRLNEYILEHGRDSPGELGQKASSPTMAHNKIIILASEICASVPQYVRCLGAARDILRTKEDFKQSEITDNALNQAGHIHSPSQNLACYSLIFPLYVAGRSKSSPKSLRLWVIKELHYMGSHFAIRNAERAAQIMEQGTDVNPWDVYAMLGSYAFVA